MTYSIMIPGFESSHHWDDLKFRICEAEKRMKR